MRRPLSARVEIDGHPPLSTSFRSKVVERRRRGAPSREPLFARVEVIGLDLGGKVPTLHGWVDLTEREHHACPRDLDLDVERVPSGVRGTNASRIEPKTVRQGLRAGATVAEWHREGSVRLAWHHDRGPGDGSSGDP
jgi:hypothetical protein